MFNIVSLSELQAVQAEVDALREVVLEQSERLQTHERFFAQLALLAEALA